MIEDRLIDDTGTGKHTQKQCNALLRLAVHEVPLYPNCRTTTQIIERLACYKKEELKKIEFPTNEYYLSDYVLRQLKRARKTGIIDGELRNAGAIRHGGNYSYISWSFSEVSVCSEKFIEKPRCKFLIEKEANSGLSQWKDCSKGLDFAEFDACHNCKAYESEQSKETTK